MLESRGSRSVQPLLMFLCLHWIWKINVSSLYLALLSRLNEKLENHCHKMSVNQIKTQQKLS